MINCLKVSRCLSSINKKGQDMINTWPFYKQDVLYADMPRMGEKSAIIYKKLLTYLLIHFPPSEVHSSFISWKSLSVMP